MDRLKVLGDGESLEVVQAKYWKAEGSDISEADSGALHRC